MFEDLIRRVEEATAASRQWAETGWPATFGPRGVAVPTLREAKALPKNAVFREEAVNYWNQARLIGNDAADAGQKALDALRRGDLSAADDALYFCQYVEKPFAEQAKTWLPLYEAFRERGGAAAA